MGLFSGAGGSDIGFYGGMEPARADLASALTPYYDAILKAHAYVAKQQEEGKPDIEKYRTKLEGSKLRETEKRMLADKLYEISSGLRKGVQKFGGSDWQLYSQTPDFQKEIAKFNDFSVDLNTAEYNRQLHDEFEKSAQDPKNGQWAKVNGELVFVDPNGLNVNKSGIPLTWQSYGKMKFTLPTGDSKVHTDQYSSEFGSFDDTQELFNKVFTNLGKSSYEGDPQFKPVVDQLGNYVQTLQTVSGSSNRRQVAEAREGFLNAVKNGSGRAYNGLRDAFYNTELSKQKPDISDDSFNRYVDSTVTRIAKSRIDETTGKSYLHIPKGTGGNSNEPVMDYWEALNNNVHNLVGDFAHPIPETGYEAQGGTFKAMNTLKYKLYLPEESKPGEGPLGIGTSLNVFDRFSIGTPAGIQMNAKNFNGYVIGKPKSGESIWEKRNVKTGEWAPVTKEEADQAGLASGKAYGQSQYRLGHYFKVPVIMPRSSAERVQGVSEKDITSGTGVLKNLYDPSFFVNDIDEYFRGDKSINAQKISASSDLLKEWTKEIAKYNPEAAENLRDGWGWDYKTVVDVWIHVNPSDWLTKDAEGPYSKYAAQTIPHTEEQRQAVQKSLVSPDVYQKAKR